MTNEEIVEKVKTARNNEILKAGVNFGDAVIHVKADYLHSLAEFLRDDPDLNFHYLSNFRTKKLDDNYNFCRSNGCYEL